MRRILSRKVFSLIVLVIVSMSLVIGLTMPQRGMAQDTGFQCPQESGLFEAEDCGLVYYSCDYGVATQLVCPESTVFYQLTQSSGYCDFPYVVEACNGSIDNFTCPAPDGLFASGACNRDFYNCREGTAYLTACPPGLVFDEAEGNCSYTTELSSCST